MRNILTSKPKYKERAMQRRGTPETYHEENKLREQEGKEFRAEWKKQMHEIFKKAGVDK